MEGVTKKKLSKFVVTFRKPIMQCKNVIYSNRNGHRNSSFHGYLQSKESNVVKEVIQKIKFPTGFASNIKNILTKKGEFGGVKTHDWHTFIKVIILVDFYIGKYMNF
jgi:hypothetical protein